MTRLYPRRTVLIGGIVAAACAKASAPASVPTIAALRKIARSSLAAGAEVQVTQAGVAGRFRWDPQSVTPEDGGITFSLLDRGPGRWLRADDGVVDVRWFGASPGASAQINSAAFAAASAVITRRDGGTLLVPPGVYRVGHQQGRRPVDIVRIDGCRRPVILLGKGATLKAADGLKFGSFDPRTGLRHEPAKLPHYDHAYRFDAYRMIVIRNCRGPVQIDGIELDGNLARYQLGGQWGDTGRQVDAYGLFIENNTGGLSVIGVNSHHHGTDGILIAHYGLKAGEPRYAVRLVDVVCDSNARQGLSWVGGNDLTATRCRFTRTGRAGFQSGPSAGVDIEPSDSICRNGRFVECSFVDNAGVGFLADYGDTADMRLERCTFVGTTTWALWPRQPGIVFASCVIAGSVVHAHPNADPARAAQFRSCRFTDDLGLSPTGKVFGEEIANFGGGKNVLVTDCTFEALTGRTTLPFSPSDVRYHDCRFRQTGSKQSYPRGIFTGTNVIESGGPVELAGSRFLGRVTLNGRPLS